MKDFTLTKKQMYKLKKVHRTYKDKRSADRIKAIYLLGSKWTQEKVCEALMIDEGTLRSYVNHYKVGGINELIKTNYSGGEGKLTKNEELMLDRHLQEKLYLEAKSVAAYIKKIFGKTYSVRGVTELLKRLGYVYKKPKIIPGKADPEAQKKFLKNYEKLKNKLKQNDKILFMDGVHPQHNTVAAYGWIKKGYEKEIKSNSGRRRLNINGALDINTCKTTITFEETLNAITVLSLFKKLRKVYKKAEKIYIICDNAGYYKTEDLRLKVKELNIELVFLPPYSPNLNIIERLWKFFRKKVMYNKYYEKFSDFRNAVETFFYGGMKKHKLELRNLLTENFQIIGLQP
jgi:transposase